MEKDFLEGRWQFVKIGVDGQYHYKNIYNNKELKLSYQQLKNVLNGKTTIGKIMCRRIGIKTSNKTRLERKFDCNVLGGVENRWVCPETIRWLKLKGKYRNLKKC